MIHARLFPRRPMDRPPLSALRGFTVLEILISVAVSSAFLVGLMAAFVQVLKASDRADAVMRAVANGRIAIDAMATDIKQVNCFPGAFVFRGINNFRQPLDRNGAPYGDAVDFDGDGVIDEERPDGRDDDGDWTKQDDLHAAIGADQLERASSVDQADLGDTHVDEDVVFDGDMVQFVRYADPADANPAEVEISFYLGSYENRDHVLLKRIRTPSTGTGAAETAANGPAGTASPNENRLNAPRGQSARAIPISRTQTLPANSGVKTATPPAKGGTEAASQPANAATETETPLAEGVLGFNVLYWQSNGSAREWKESWDSDGPETLTAPGFRLPAAVCLTLWMYADDRPIELYRAGEPCRVETLSTVVTIEQVIHDSAYPLPPESPASQAAPTQTPSVDNGGPWAAGSGLGLGQGRNTRPRTINAQPGTFNAQPPTQGARR